MAVDPTYPKTPELDKLADIQERSQEIGEFLEWLLQRGVVLAKAHKHTDACGEIDLDEEDSIMKGISVLIGRGCGLRDGQLEPFYYVIEKLLAEYFRLDLDRIEMEKRAVLEYARSIQR